MSDVCVFLCVCTLPNSIRGIYRQSNVCTNQYQQQFNSQNTRPINCTLFPWIERTRGTNANTTTKNASGQFRNRPHTRHTSAAKNNNKNGPILCVLFGIATIIKKETLLVWFVKNPYIREYIANPEQMRTAPSAWGSASGAKQGTRIHTHINPEQTRTCHARTSAIDWIMQISDQRDCALVVSGFVLEAGQELLGSTLSVVPELNVKIVFFLNI